MVVSLCGIALLVLDAILIGWVAALLKGANDPAKIYFHVVILPLASAIFVFAFPARRVRDVLRGPGPRTLAGFAACSLFAANVLFSWQDSVEGFETRISPPQCFLDPTVRSLLLYVDQTLRSQLTTKSTPLDLSNAPLELQRRLVDPHDSWIQASTGAEAAAQYRDIELALLAWNGTDPIIYKTASSLPAPSFFQHSSLRVWWAAVLTFMGVCLPMAWFWTVFVYRCGPNWNKYRESQEGLHDGFVGAAAITLTLLATWVLLKIYSEWYTKFFSSEWLGHGELWVAFLAAMGALALLWVVKTQLSQTGVTVTTVAAGLVAAGAAGGWLSPKTVDQVAEKYRAMLPHQMVLAHFVLLFVIAGVVLAWWQDARRVDGSDLPQSPHDDWPGD
ncbi:MAG TPA: hypothetical protein VF777_06505 [Phycisphaerales bacterium]